METRQCVTSHQHYVQWQAWIDPLLGEESGSTLLRTVRTATSTMTYASAEQTADFGSPPSSLSLKIYQISALVGRGNLAQSTVPVQ